MEYIFVDYGRQLPNQIQVAFAVVSVLAHGGRDANVHITTDAPDSYQQFAEQVDIIPFSHEQLEEWMGPRHYTFRAKIMAIRNAIDTILQRGACGHFMYLDSDVFAYKDLEGLNVLLDKGIGVMHADEGMPYETYGASRRLWPCVKGKTFQNIKVEEGCHMWNSGVIGLPKDCALAVCDLTLALCDEMLVAVEGKRVFNVEQFCFSLALGKFCQGMAEARDYICHYWGNKEGWQQKIAQFFMACWLQKQNLKEMAEAFLTLDKTDVPYYYRDPIWRRRFVKWASALIPIKDLKSIGC